MMKRWQLLAPVICLSAGALFFSLTKAIAFAPVPVSLVCDKSAGFLPDPNQHKRVGYISSLSLGSLVAKSDLQVFVPWTNKTAPSYSPFSSIVSAPSTLPKASVVGVISTFSWAGGAGDPLKITAFVSQQNASKFGALKTPLPVHSLGFWIVDYDQIAKASFEEFFPRSSALIQGQLSNGGLTVNISGAPASVGIDVMAYQVDLVVAPPPNQAVTFLQAGAAATSSVRPWGVATPANTKK